MEWQRCQLCGRVLHSDSAARQHLTEMHSDNPLVKKALRGMNCETNFIWLWLMLACLAFLAVLAIGFIIGICLF